MKLSKKKAPRQQAAMLGVGKSSWFNLLFILPFLVGYVLLLVYPVFNGFWLSLHEIDQLSDSSEFVGLANFARLFSDEIFRGTVPVGPDNGRNGHGGLGQGSWWRNALGSRNVVQHECGRSAVFESAWPKGVEQV